MKKVLSVILTLVILFCVPVHASANSVSDASIQEIDSLLREANTPESMIETMEDELKCMIYENTLSKGEVEYITVEKDSSAGSMSRAGYEISEDDLVLSVIAFKVLGKEQVEVYPSYEWKIPVKPKGKDYFAYSIHESYTAVSGARSNLMWYKINEDDEWTSDGSATYTGSSLYGYQHQGSSLGSPDFKLYLKGHFYYKVDIDVEDPVKKITLSYVHDISSGGTYSYGIGFGPYSISVNPTSNNVGYLNDNFDLVY